MDIEEFYIELGTRGSREFLDKISLIDNDALNRMIQLDTEIKLLYPSCDRIIYTDKKARYQCLTYGSKEPGKNTKKGLPFDVSDSCEDAERLLHNGELGRYFS
jgi:hypothetical protein